MKLPKEWEAIASQISHGVIVRDVVERCYALTQKTPRELTDEELDDAFFQAVPDLKTVIPMDRKIMRAAIAAHERKQQDPVTVNVDVYFYRLENGDVIASSIGPAPIKQEDAPELLHTQTIEVVVK